MYRDFTPHEQALALKDLEFDEPCIGFFKGNTHVKAIDQHWGSSISGISKSLGYKIDDLVLAPTFSQAFRWFREKHKLFSKIELEDVELNLFSYEILQDKEGKYNNELYIDIDFKTYEEAELACLIKLIEIQKELNVK